jgi:hypothetical protein
MKQQPDPDAGGTVQSARKLHFCSRNADARDRVVCQHRQAFAAAVIDHAQDPEQPAIDQSQFMHGDADRYWYSMAASINRIVNDEAAQIEDALIDVEIDKALVGYINGMADRGNFDAVQVAPATSAEVPDEPGGVRAVVLGIASPHSSRANTDALGAAKDILQQRGTSPRQYRNMLVFMAANER